MNIWQIKKLGEVCDILDNKRKPITKRDRTAGEYPYYGATGILDYVKNYIFDEKLILIGEDGAKWEPGEHTAFIADGKYWVNNHAHVIRPNRDTILDNWIVYFFYLTDLTEYTTGLTVPKLNQANLRSIEIPLPPLSEQKRIVKILDEVFGGIEKAKENAEKNLKNSQELFESYLQGAFTNAEWEEVMLGDKCDTSAGGTPLKSHKEYYKDGDIPWLRSGEVDKKEIIESELFITKSGLKNSSAKLFPPDTVLVAMYGATAGQVGILRFESSTNQAVCGILPNNNFLPEFLYYAFLSKKSELVAQAVGGAQPNISQMKIRNTFVPKLEVSEQKEIVEKLDALSGETKKLEAIFRRKIADLDELKKSVLKQAFAGEL